MIQPGRHPLWCPDSEVDDGFVLSLGSVERVLEEAFDAGEDTVGGLGPPEGVSGWR